MRLRKFSIKNYRSIRSTPRISLENNLTIVGPNNEGKSNIVRAIVAALSILEEHADGRRSLMRRRSINGRIMSGASYDWNTDCHVALKTRNKSSQFYLEFALNDADVDEFYNEIGSAINGFLPIEITVGEDNRPEFSVRKPGKAGPIYRSKSVEIARFIGRKLSINHIPAIRTSEEAVDAVSHLASTSLRLTEKHPEYLQAIETIERIQQPLYEQLEAGLQESLIRFLPSIESVSLGFRGGTLRRALRSVDIQIDDGQLTPLENKGDGVISLVSMALLARLRESSGASFNTILAVEEPESHLHPKAIHSIREVLDDIGDDYQVIVTTHSPVLVDRLNVKANIIVENSQARIAQDIMEIREALGVRVSDNLSHARVVIICEGEEDEVALKTILSEMSDTLAAAFRHAEIGFYPMGGVSNLPYAITLLQQSISEPVCFLDNDSPAHSAAEKAIEMSLIGEDDFIYAVVPGKAESELEDIFDYDQVREDILKRFKVNIDNVERGFKTKKFSDRCAQAFKLAGKAWNPSIKMRVKAGLARKAESSGIKFVGCNNRGPLETLVLSLKEKLQTPSD